MPLKTTTRTADEGFTLAEVLVALAVVMLVGVAVLRGIIGGLSAQRAAEGHDVAVQVGVDRLEEVRQLEWERLVFYESTQNTTGQTGYDYTPYHPCGSTSGCPGEPVAYLYGTPPSNPLHATVTKSGYRVHTYITWVMPTGESTYPVNQEGKRYAAKRVRIVVEGTRAGKAITESVETVIAPPVNQSPPPGVPVASTTDTTTESATTEGSTTASTCPTVVTVVGSPPTLEWNTVPEGVTSYRVLVSGALHEIVAHDGRSRYAWDSPLYGSVTTYEVRGVSSTGVALACRPVTWDPANPG